MPDTFDPQYTWLRTWKENPRPPILFYGTSSNLTEVIKERGLEPSLAGENHFREEVNLVLCLAKKLEEGRSTAFAEIILKEHGGPLAREPELAHLRLTFNYQHALQEARRTTRRLEALLWLYEVFLEQIERKGLSPEEAALKEAKNRYEQLQDLPLAAKGIIVHVRTDLKKFINLPPFIEDKKELKRAVKGKGHWCKNYLPKGVKWRHLSRPELERCMEGVVRSSQDLGWDIETSEPIPPSDIVKIELVQP